MNAAQIDELAGSAKYQGKSLRGTVEETHISWVILTPQFAFKIKKPVKLSFLDFSTLKKRKKYCERELALNRRFSEIYLRVVPVRFDRGVWRLGSGPGKIADYAVMMKRLDSSKRMDVLLQSGSVRPLHIRALANRIAAFHSKADIIKRPFVVDDLADAFNDIRVARNFARKALPGRYDDLISKSQKWSHAFLLHHERRIKERVRLGFQRDGHGDLHSGNIFLNKHPEIFDCIEFNDRYRQIDVLNEIAFFCMDLEAFGEPRLANLFVEEYNRQFPSFLTSEDRNLFVYFKCYRANVRAKVHALAAEQAVDQKNYRRHKAAVRTYLQLMRGYMQPPKI
jgi:uncharacterized protein